MTKTSIKIWGRKLRIDVIFDHYEGEDILPVQKEAIEKFLENIKVVDEAEPKVKKYCLKSDQIEDDKIDNIFKYVKPKALVAMRSKKDRIVVLLCDYKLDLEHGLAIEFKNEIFRRIGNSEIVL